MSSHEVAIAAADEARPQTRLRVRSTRVCAAREVTPADADRAWEIFSRLYDGVDRATFHERVLLREGRARVAFLEGVDGEVAGFGACHVETVRRGTVTHAVFVGGAYVDLRYRDGGAIGAFGFREALLHKLRHPWHHVAYVGAIMTPAAYCMNVRGLPVLHPHRFAPPPPEITSLVAEVGLRLGWRPIDGDPWVVCDDYPAVLRAPARLCRAAATADGAFYVRTNPSYREGTLMAVYAPLDANQALRGAARLLGLGVPPRSSTQI